MRATLASGLEQPRRADLRLPRARPSPVLAGPPRSLRRSRQHARAVQRHVQDLPPLQWLARRRLAVARGHRQRGRQPACQCDSTCGPPDASCARRAVACHAPSPRGSRLSEACPPPCSSTTNPPGSLGDVQSASSNPRCQRSLAGRTVVARAPRHRQPHPPKRRLHRRLVATHVSHRFPAPCACRRVLRHLSPTGPRRTPSPYAFAVHRAPPTATHGGCARRECAAYGPPSPEPASSATA